MKTSKPPFIAAWLLDRFGADPQLDAVAGDLLEQYQLGRSRFWYWREVFTAITVGVWSETIRHYRVVFRAAAGGWFLVFVWGYLVAPYEISLVSPYLLDAPPSWLPIGGRLQILLLALVIDGPVLVMTGQIVVRLSRPCRIPAMLAFWASVLLWSAVNFLMNPTIYDVSVLWQFPLAAILFFLGGGLLTRTPKRTISTH